MKAKHRERIEKKLAEHGDEYQKSFNMLMGYEGTYRYDEELFRRIGAYFFASGNIPRAGLYWMMTLERSPQAVQAIDAAIAEYGTLLPKELPLRIPANELPGEVLSGLCAAVERTGIDRPMAALMQVKEGKDRMGEVVLGGCIVCLTLTLILAITGLVFLIMLLLGYRLVH